MVHIKTQSKQIGEKRRGKRRKLDTPSGQKEEKDDRKKTKNKKKIPSHALLYSIS